MPYQNTVYEATRNRIQKKKKCLSSSSSPMWEPQTSWPQNLLQNTNINNIVFLSRRFSLNIYLSVVFLNTQNCATRIDTQIKSLCVLIN